MKQQLDEVRTLAVKLFEASRRQMKKHPREIWGYGVEVEFHHLPSESVEVWDAVALAAIELVNQKS